MAKTMKAAVVHAFGQALAIEEVPVPTPGPGQVLVRSSPAVCVTPICTPPTATGPSNRRCRSYRGMKGLERSRRLDRV